MRILKKVDVLEKKGKKVVLLGNEAIVRGALEAGVGVATAYPGTPSSEVPMTFSRIAKQAGVYFEYSTNEKVAFETAAGAAYSGVPAIVSMKHFGLNVASDSVMPVIYTGVKAPLIIMVADDPQGWSSAQSEQDSRFYSRLGHIPTIEPANPQECKDFTVLAFKISEEFNIPVMLRTTTKVSHSIGTVKLGEVKKPKRKGKFVKDKKVYYNIRPNLQKLHELLLEKNEKIRKKYSEKLVDVIPGSKNLGVICSGVSYEYVLEAVKEMKVKPRILRIKMTYPLPVKMISKFIKDLKSVVVVEELEPIIEEEVKAIAKEVNPKLVVHGKDLLPSVGEYNTEDIISAFEKLYKKKYHIDFKKHLRKAEAMVKDLPPRKPSFCQGCPHRSTFYAVKKVLGSKTIYAGDIGCYILGIFEPYEMQDFIISMGASEGITHGIMKSTKQKPVVFIGDSTFFHAGMPGLANFHFNKTDALVIILDNSVTAMTGHQPHPGTGRTGMNESVPALKLEEIAKALGADNVRVVNSFNQKEVQKAVKELYSKPGVNVIVSRGECRLLFMREMKKEQIQVPKFQIDPEKCVKCGVCTDEFACPAIIKEGKGKNAKYYINEDMCWGCSVCAQICPYNAIKPARLVKRDDL